MKPLHAGLYGLAVTGALLDDGNEDVEERYRRIQAEQEAKNIGAVIGLVAGVAWCSHRMSNHLQNSSGPKISRQNKHSSRPCNGLLFCCLTVASGERNDMAYKFKYNERPRSYSEEKHGDEDIPSAKAVRDTAVEERDDKIIKSRRQHVCGREYIVFAEFSFGGTQSTVDLMKQVIDLEQDAKNISA